MAKSGLDPLQKQRFEEQGYLVLEDVIEAAILDDLRQEYSDLINHLAQELIFESRLPTDFTERSFDERYTQLVCAEPQMYQYLDITLPLLNDIPADAGMYSGPAVFKLLSHPKLLDIVQSVVGPEIYSNPVQHTRIKPPECLLPKSACGDSNMARTLWHQDEAVVLESAAGTDMLTVWVAISDASEQMGCMIAVPGSHRLPSLALHCPGKSSVGEIYIPESLVQQHNIVPLPVQAGGVVLLHRRTWHAAGPNTSRRLRWSFDLRYQKPGLPTGRDYFPGFLARSAAHPDQVLTDPKVWAQSWRQARADISTGKVRAVFNERWEQHAQHPLCA